MFREFFINDSDDDELQSKPRGRPKNNDKYSSLNQRKSIVMTIENANSLFDNQKEKGKTHLPPGNVKYTNDFLKLFPKYWKKKIKIKLMIFY